MKKVLFLFIFILIYFGQNSAQEIKQVEIPGTRVLKIYSSIVEQEYNLLINIPRFFDDKTRRFSVVYLLDAQWDFPLLNAVYGEQYYDGFIPEAITVGITWGGENPDHDLLRRRDFTPTQIQYQPVGGGAEKFLAFIKNELIPFIDSTFNAKPNERTLIGSSLGGLFTLYAMFNEPELFNKYILTSPALNWDNEIIYSYEKKFSGQNPANPLKLFMAIGEYEDVKGFQKFVNHLEERDYSNIKIKTRVLDCIGHSGSKAEGYTRGLQFAFAKEQFPISDDLLEKYCGKYEAGPSFIIELKKENSQLVARISNEGSIILYPQNEDDFYVKGQYLFVHFTKDDQGSINGFEVENYNGKNFVSKID